MLREPSFENLQRLNSDLSRLRLTREEKQATTQLLLGGGTDAICEQAYQEAAVHMPQVVAELRALNPDAQIILVGYTNPVPLLPEWTQLFRRLNALGKSLAAQNENVTYVPIPFAMTATDAHPTVSGHKYIANRILRAIKKYPQRTMPGSLQAVRHLLSPPKIARFRWITRGEILRQFLAEFSRAAGAAMRCCVCFCFAAAALAFTACISSVQ